MAEDDPYRRMYRRRLPSDDRRSVKISPAAQRHLEHRAIIAFAGLVAEKKWSSERYNGRGSDPDTQAALNTLREMCENPEEVDAYARLQFLRATNLVERHWQAIEAVAAELVRSGELSGARVAEIAGAQPRAYRTLGD